MNVWNSYEAFPTGREPMFATIGNFDGVHLGHQAILKSVIGSAKARSAPSLLITFDPHPLAVVAPSRRPKLLQTRRQIGTHFGGKLGQILIQRRILLQEQNSCLLNHAGNQRVEQRAGAGDVHDFLG